MQYKKEERLKFYARIGVTKEVHRLLRRKKRQTRMSMGKLVCNLVMKEYSDESSEKEHQTTQTSD